MLRHLIAASSLLACGSFAKRGHHAGIFEPVFTTKESGMGMGLSICRSIVEAHSGRIWATADEDVGTTFSFTLPLTADGAA